LARQSSRASSSPASSGRVSGTTPEKTRLLRSPVPNPTLPLSSAQRLAWLRLIRTENVGPVTFRELVNHFGGAIEAIAALPELSQRGGRSTPIKVCPVAEAEAEIERGQRADAQLVALGEAGYPAWLAQVEAPPPLLYVKGMTELAARPIVSIVGARNGSAAGLKIARTLAVSLGAQGFVIASGLARGIDGAAHRAALERGTMAIVAGGIDVVYPPEHADLQRAIGESGLLVTERAPGFEPRAQDFPRRNRIIAGVAAAVVVVEAARRSGSLITARLAAELGREVFAVPGNPLDPRAEGTNGLIKNGANLLTEAEDVVRALEPILGRTGSLAPPALGEPIEDDAPEPASVMPDDARAQVVAALGPAPVEIDEIARATGLHIRHVRIALMELDLAGRLERHPGNLVSLLAE
jgi:DNA processing protein